MHDLHCEADLERFPQLGPQVLTILAQRTELKRHLVAELAAQALEISKVSPRLTFYGLDGLLSDPACNEPSLQEYGHDRTTTTATILQHGTQNG